MEERNLDLAARNEDTRDKFHTEVIKFELDQILQHFAETIQAINAQFDVVDVLSVQIYQPEICPFSNE